MLWLDLFIACREDGELHKVRNKLRSRKVPKKEPVAADDDDKELEAYTLGQDARQERLKKAWVFFVGARFLGFIVLFITRAQLPNMFPLLKNNLSVLVPIWYLKLPMFLIF